MSSSTSAEEGVRTSQSFRITLSALADQILRSRSFNMFVLSAASTVLLGLCVLGYLYFLAMRAQSSPGPKACEYADMKCQQNAVLGVLESIRADIDYWNMVSVTSIILAGLFGILATVMIALQGDLNKLWTRPIGIVSTALVTGITALTSSLNVPERVDKMIDIYVEIVDVWNKYENDFISIPTDEHKKRLHLLFTRDFARLRGQELKIKGSAGRFRSDKQASDDARGEQAGSKVGTRPPSAM